jgi:PadR family transcriptional regulator PadR
MERTNRQDNKLKGQTMTDTSAALVQGTLDMLILKTLALEPLHGWGISQRIQQLSRGVFEVNPGSLFPAFRRLERAGLLECSLTRAGRQKLKSETKEWERQVAAIARILQTAS